VRLKTGGLGMIVLHDQKMIALKAKKVGGTSFEIALSKFATETSIITPIVSADEDVRRRLGFRGPQNYRYSFIELINLASTRILRSLFYRQRPEKFYNHISASLARERLGDKIWEDYTKIAIIRNPFDFMVSSYFWESKRTDKGALLNFEAWVLKNPDRPLFNKTIYEIDGKNIIDFMIRYERLNEDIEAIETKYPSLEGLAEIFRNIRVKGEFRPKDASTKEMFSDAPRARKLIEILCEDDIERYGFEMP
jgi:hypothetical protein